MPIQPQRTRTFRRIKKKLAGRLTIHYKKRKPKPAHCANCKKVLHGMPRDLPFKIRKLPKTQRRPERIYGGVLCPACLKIKLEKQYQKKQFPLEVGRLCIKTSGREAGSFCVVVDKKDKFVVIDGRVKRRRCNINHLIALEQTIDIKKGAATPDVIKKLKAIKIEVKQKKKKTPKPRPRKQRKVKEKKEKSKKEIKKKPKKKKTSKKK